MAFLNAKFAKVESQPKKREQKEQAKDKQGKSV
jgi:hypothetical protein